tara:strand:+ start:8352 stop:15455 length:7104 start_codon:yes stop_codon:yes gene_type:complete
MVTRLAAEGSFKKYGFWLAGYYEDFQGVRCVADDTNTPSVDGAYDTNSTHHGNIMNGEATLNPRFRWSIRDRVTNNEFASADSYLLHNKSIANWATLDTIRLSLGENYEGRARPQFPSWAHTNRVRYDKSKIASTDDTYMLLASGHDTSIQYYVPLGDTDPTYGRSEKHDFNNLEWKYGTIGLPATNSGASGSLPNLPPNNNSDPHFYQIAHLTGCFMGERVQMGAFTGVSASDTTIPLTDGSGDLTIKDYPERIWFPIKSPAKKPFLNVTTYMRDTDDHRLNNVGPAGNYRPVIACTAPLNSRGDGEYFTIRIAHQAYNGENTTSNPAAETTTRDTNIGNDLKYVLKVGFPSGTTFGTTGSNGGTAAIEWTFKPTAGDGLANGDGLDYHTSWDAGELQLRPIDDYSAFYDLDFKLDYTNNKFKVYHNGTEVTATNASAGSYSSGYTLKNDTSTSAAFLPKNMTGWELFTNTDSAQGAVIHTMIDRASLYIPLTDPADGTKLPPPIQNWSCSLTANGSSNGDITILDDDKEQDMTKFFMDDEVVDWKLLMFNGNIDRPLWQGVINSVKINQNADTNTREIIVSAKDSLGLMDRQLASWQVGQIGMGEADTVLARKNEMADLNNSMYLGASRLKISEPTIGYESGTSYKELHDQRTVVHSAHPIQMYNNEDSFGPNDSEDEWLGYKVIGINKNSSGDCEYILEGTVSPVFAKNDNVVVYGSKDHNIVAAIPGSGSPVGTFSGKVAINVTGSSFTRTTTANLLQNKAEAPDGTSDSVSWFKFSSRPYREEGDYLKVGEYIILPEHPTSQTGDGDYLVTAIEESGGYFWAKTNSYSTAQTGSDIHYCIDKGFIRLATGHAQDTDNRNAHAIWMRDIAMSRWFRKHFGIYAFEPESGGSTAFYLQDDITASATVIRVNDEEFFTGNTSDWTVSSGVGQIIDADGFIDTFTYLGCKSWAAGTHWLVGVSGLSKDHSAGAKIQSMKVSDDYKHMWLLWSDMRNNGHASADGGYRNKQFGLLQPARDNYELDISFTDQFNELGMMDSYTDLKIDSDLDFWEIDPTSDPTTGLPFSYGLETRLDEVRQTRAGGGGSNLAIETSGGTTTLYADTTAAHGVSGLTAGDYIYIFNCATSTTAYEFNGVHKIISISSNDIVLETPSDAPGSGAGNVTFDAGVPAWYQGGSPFFLKVEGSYVHDSNVDTLKSWENRGGALLAIDASKFFNLNTYINGGRAGQTHGSRKTLADWDNHQYGFPILMDNYWKDATASHENHATPYGLHQNHRNLITEVAELNRTVLLGDTVIETKPSTSLISGFPDFGYGKIKATKEENQQVSSEVFWYAYEGKLDTSIVESATSVTSAGASPYRITCSAADFVNEGVKVGMRVRNVTAKWVGQITAVTATTIDITEADIFQETGSTRTTVASSDSISIPQQLYGCYIFSDGSNNYTSAEAEAILNGVAHQPTLSGSGSTAEIAINLPTSQGTTGAFDEVIIAATVSSRYALRFLMNLKGFVETPNFGTFWMHDKMRFMWSFMLSNSWLTQASINAWYDLGSIPNYYRMTTDGTSSNFDSFGSINDCRDGKTLFSMIRESVESTGFGYSNDKRISVTYQIGKDNKLEIRPAYNCGEGLTRNSFSANSINAGMGGHISNVRVYYNNGASFSDYPAPTLNQKYRWKVIEVPEATSAKEAQYIAKEEYEKSKKKNLKMSGKVLRDLTFDDKMLSQGRTGYITDVARWCERGVTAKKVIANSFSTSTEELNYCWSNPQSGSLFPGMVNALDGHLSSVPTNGDTLKRDRFGYGNIAQATANYVRSPYSEQYYWWGANSIAQAVQMVHVPSTCPTSSQVAENDDLRMIIALKDGQSGTDIDNAEFTIYISDVTFNESPSPAFEEQVTGSTHSRQYSPNFAQAGHSTTTLNVKYSGFYEIDIPSGYWSSGKPSGAKFVISVDCEYLRSLLRRRCGDPTASGILHNAHHIGLASNFAATSTDSLFPLGAREYSNMTGAYDTRSLWYAPRILITEDLRWRPATQVTVTDDGFNLSNEPMIIKDIKWSVSGNDIEDVQLNLERDQTKESGGLASYLFPNVSKTKQGSGGGVGNGGGNGLPGGGYTYPPINDGGGGLVNQNGGGYSGSSGGLTLGSTAYTPPLYQGGISTFGASDGSFSTSITTNNLSLGTYSNLKGRMDIGDVGDSEGTWSILGQKKTPTKKNTQRSVDGLDSLNTPSSAGATTTEEGFVLPGIIDPDSSDRYTHTQSIKVGVPDDIANETISVDCSYSMGGTAANIGVLTVEVKCEETGNSKSRTFKVIGNQEKKKLNLMGTIPLTGVSTKGNTVKVTIKRTAGSGDDDATYSSIVIHNIKVNFQRYSIKGKGNQSFTTGTN